MGWLNPPPPPPPAPLLERLTYVPPAASVYGIALVFVIVSQLITVPLCILAHKYKQTPAVLYSLGIFTSMIPFYVQPWFRAELLERGYATPLDTILGCFFGGTIYAFVALRMFGAAVGATPKGADADVATWITFATGSLSRQNAERGTNSSFRTGPQGAKKTGFTIPRRHSRQCAQS